MSGPTHAFLFLPSCHSQIIGFFNRIAGCRKTEVAANSIASGLIYTFIFAAAGLFLILKKGTKRENRYYSAVLLYAALGTLMFGVMMGET